MGLVVLGSIDEELGNHWQQAQRCRSYKTHPDNRFRVSANSSEKPFSLAGFRQVSQHERAIQWPYLRELKPITENQIEEYALNELQALGYSYSFGPSLGPSQGEGGQPERESYEQVLLLGRLRDAVARINPDIPAAACEAAIKRIERLTLSGSPSGRENLTTNNEEFHSFLIEKVRVPYQKDGFERSHEVALIDFGTAGNNDFLAVNQFTVQENNHTKRIDVLLFVNGIPLVLLEVKNPADENASIQSAFKQVETYKALIPSIFNYNAFSVISDGHEARAGTISAGLSRFMAWKSVDGNKDASKFTPQIDTLVRGMLNRETLLDLVRNFIVFEKSKKEDPKTGITQIETVKKLAAYHQYYAVNKAIESTLRAAGYSQPSLNPSQREGLGRTGAGQAQHAYAPSLSPSQREGSSNYRGGFEFAGLLDLARELRKKQTSAEEIFWELVRNKRFLGLKFRRQHQIGDYVVDFYCHEKKLVVEFDGEVHDSTEQQRHDSIRDKYLTTLGNKVVRFKNAELLDSPEPVLDRLSSLLSPWERSGEGCANRRAGVIWHTQGSGKSLSMVFYSGKLVQSLDNPTIVLITDRNDLDEQLFGTFAGAKQLLRQEPVQAQSRDHLKELLKVASGGIVFTTIQKFLPTDGGAVYDTLSERKNIVVIADEAHRTQYGFEAEVRDIVDSETKEIVGQRLAYGFAKYLRDALPNATYVGFTGTPIEKEDKNTPQVFGDYIDKYDIKDAVDDKATVPILYESRLAKVNLTEEGRRLLKQLDTELEDNAAVTDKQKAKAKWTQVEAVVGNTQRVKNLAADILKHFEARQAVFVGKAMIVAMSRRIAAQLYDEIIALRPDWHDTDKAKGRIKVIMTATSSDGPELARHHTTKQERRALADRFKDENDPLSVVIVIDMWLTGFDAPCLHTLYVDKLMRGHTLMQAIARVNRVFKDKPGGLVVDYLGLAGDLKKALSFYGNAGGKGDPTEDIEKAVHVLREKKEVVEQMFSEASSSREDILQEDAEAYDDDGFAYKRFFTADPRQKMEIILEAEEHILGIDNGKERFVREVALLSQAFALTMPHPAAAAMAEEVAFFQALKARIAKFGGSGAAARTDEEIDTAIRRIVDASIRSDKVVDIFDAVGMDKPNISILSDEFLLEVKGMKHKNLAIELLRKILNDEVSVRMKKNLVKSKAMLEMLETAIKKYQNNLLSTSQIIEELIKLARDVRESDKEGERLGLTEDEVAFYNALEVNDSAVKVLGDDTLRDIAREIADKIKKNATIDWPIRESSRAKLMVLVRRTLAKHGYPPDKQPKAIETVLAQAVLLADQVTAG
ncbi:MAG: HsdR family type I site-specific deoxyribonuclease [Acidobacteria bacterium]|nr:HsdR family type I site-specific deoxyribonuclease [Acidobacteriota bacterium]